MGHVGSKARAAGKKNPEESDDEDPKKEEEPKRVRKGYKISEVDEWIKEDAAKEIPMATNFVVGDRVKSNGKMFTVHEIKRGGLILKHDGGAFRHNVQNDEVEAA